MYQKQRAIEKTVEFLGKAHICLHEEEQRRIEIATFALEDYPRTGLQLFTYINTPRYCAKDLVLFPGQTCPEHLHPPFDNNPGKQETFRCRWGDVWLFVDDHALTPYNLLSNSKPACAPPAGDEQWYQCRYYIRLYPGDQYTIPPNTRHWFQAGKRGAVISEFSSASRDELDIFTDPRVIRVDSAG